jgi:maleylacetate reductase
MPPLTAPSVRQISVPTTIAGGEFSAIAGVTNEATKVKEMLRHDLVMPRAVILDPAITVHTPQWLFLSTGIRAVDHCVEGLCSREAHPYADAQALKGLSMLAQALPRVKADAGDIDARMDCQIGTWLSMGPLSAGIPMGASHGIGYVLGATRIHLLRDAAIGDALEQTGQYRTSGLGVGRDGTSRRGCRRRAGPFHPGPRNAAQPA